jgi:hypothetical protein
MDNQPDNTVHNSLGFKLGRFTAYTLLLIFIAAVFVTPISILTAQTRQTQFASLFIFAVALICMTLMISHRSEVPSGIKFIIIVLPIVWLVLVWTSVLPQLLTNTAATSSAPPNSIQLLSTQIPEATQSTVSSESSEVSIARIAASASVVVAIIGVIGVMITAWATVRSAKVTGNRK